MTPGVDPAKKRRKGRPGNLEVERLRLGRYPFRAGVKVYAERMRGRWRGRTTMPEEVRKLYQLADVFEVLKDAGKVTTTDPRHLKEKDIQQFLMHISALDPDSQRRHISRLNLYLKFYKNFTIEEMLAQGFALPRCAHKNVRYIERGDLMDIMDAAERMGGWHGTVCRGMVALYLSTGVRPSELRLAEHRDMDLKHERLYVRHPKGEGSWAVYLI